MSAFKEWLRGLDTQARNALAQATPPYQTPYQTQIPPPSSMPDLTLSVLEQARRLLQAQVTYPPFAAQQPPVPKTLTNGQSTIYSTGANFSVGATNVSPKTPAIPALTAKPSEVIPFLVSLFRAKRAPFLWGAPGIGKSALVKRAAAEYYAAETGGTVDGQGRVHDAQGRFVAASEYFADIRLVLLDPVDLRGLPTVKDGATSWAPPVFLPRTERPAPFIVFLDELNRAPALTQNGAMSLALDRHLGEWVAPRHVCFVSAGNRESDGGGVTRMNPALSRRFVHVDVEPDLDDYCNWGVQNDVDPLVIAFLRFRPNLLNVFERDQRTSPSPRSWEFVSDILKQSAPRAIERLLVTGTVGQGAAIEFQAFTELYRALPSVDAILLDPEGASVPGPHEVGVLFALSSAMAARSKVDNFGRVLAYLKRLPREYAVSAIRDATLRDADLTRTPDFTKWAVLNADLL